MKRNLLDHIPNYTRLHRNRIELVCRVVLTSLAYKETNNDDTRWGVQGPQLADWPLAVRPLKHCRPAGRASSKPEATAGHAGSRLTCGARDQARWPAAPQQPRPCASLWRPPRPAPRAWPAPPATSPSARTCRCFPSPVSARSSGGSERDSAPIAACSR